MPVSPAEPSTILLVDVVFPGGQRVAYETSAREIESYPQGWMIDGVIEITAGDAHWRLEAGDCLAMRLDRPTAYRNPARKAARYLVALATVGGTRDARRR